jgi:hypothetical protein
MLLICDAWFDLMTAGPNDFRIAILTAALGDLPLAAILITGALRLVRLTVIRMWLLEPKTRCGGCRYSPDSAGPSDSSFRNPSSSRIGTPSSTALSYFDPGESPATT